MIELHFFLSDETRAEFVARELRPMIGPERSLRRIFHPALVDRCVQRVPSKEKETAAALAHWWSLTLEDKKSADSIAQILREKKILHVEPYLHDELVPTSSGIIGHEKFAAPHYPFAVGGVLYGSDGPMVPLHFEPDWGLNSRVAWLFPGGGGDNVRIHLVERGWTQTSNTDPEIPGIPAPPAATTTDHADHGDMTIRTLCAKDRVLPPVWCEQLQTPPGTCGIVPRAKLELIQSTWSFGDAFRNISPHIFFEGLNAAPGIWLFELQLAGSNDAAWAAEKKRWAQALTGNVNIDLARRLPIDVAPIFMHWLHVTQSPEMLVVLPLGNGTMASVNPNIWPYYQASVTYLNRCGINIVRPAPALRVFATNLSKSPAGYGVVRTLHANSNFVPYNLLRTCGGPGYGIGVYRGGTSPDPYTDTSAAAAVITGAAAAVQGVSGGTSTSTQLLNGFCAANAAREVHLGAQLVGHVPDVKVVIDALAPGKLTPDIKARDQLFDEGEGHVSQSPDILISSNPKLDAHHVGPDQIVADTLQVGVLSHLYVRVFNTGPGVAHNVFCRIFWAEPSDLATPNMWNYILSSRIDAIPAGGWSLTPAMSWVPKTSGHFCFIAEIAVGGDVMPDRWAAMHSYSTFAGYIASSDNVIWRNFDVVPLSGPGVSAVALRLRLVGLGAAAEPTQLQMVHTLPLGAVVALTPEGKAEGGHRHLNVSHPINTPLSPGKRQIVELGKVLLARRDDLFLNAEVSLPADARGDFQLSFRRLWGTTPIGGMTWMLRRTKPLS